jgi:hypothetical protein
VLQALATVGMEPGQLIALAFQELAQSADKIGQLNVTPELLSELLNRSRTDVAKNRKQDHPDHA